tara:strand:+ start:2874 stop:3347 length:474 start_codon:yes stop_codon:yes gene_type:complete
MASSVNLDTSDVLNITCRKGDSFSLTLTLKDSSGTALTLSTSKYEFLMQVKSESFDRRSRTSTSNLVIGTASAAKKNQGRAKEQSNINSGVNFEVPTVDDSGNVTIEASAATMSQVPSGSYRYDLQYILPNTSGLDTHRTILRGKFVVNADIAEAFE